MTFSNNMHLKYIPFLLVGISFFLASCGVTSRIDKRTDHRPTAATGKTLEEGVASWYGPNFHGKLTANGEKYDMYGLTAAHRTLPFNTVVEVENLDNGKTVQVRINDRGPFAKNRIIDLSKKAAEEIDMVGPGTANVALYLIDGDLENSRTTNLKVATYTVQLASFDEEYKAYAHARKIRGSRVEKINLDNRTVFRVYYGIYTREDEARRQQRKLEREGFEGYVKQIEN